MIRRPPRSTRTDTLFPYTTLFRSAAVFVKDVKNLVLTSYYDMPAVVTQSDGSTRPITLAVAQPMNTRSEEHTSELQSLMRISYAVFCLKKKNTITRTQEYPCS